MRASGRTPPLMIRRCRYRFDRERWQVPRSVFGAISHSLERLELPSALSSRRFRYISFASGIPLAALLPKATRNFEWVPITRSCHHSSFLPVV